MLAVDAEQLARRAELREECFGPAELLARYADEDAAVAALGAFEGQLAAAIFAEIEQDAALVERLSAVLRERVGRLVLDAYPTRGRGDLGDAARRALPGDDRARPHVRVG